MRLLVLGGSSFAGRRVVERAIAAGYDVTTFNRGRTNPDLFPTVRSLRGDRATGDYAALGGAGPFDAVVDMCAYFPRATREALAALGPGGVDGPYVLISSVSAYAEPRAEPEGDVEPGADVEPGVGAGFTEESPLAPLPDGTDPTGEEVTGETYGPLKVLTEEATRTLLPDGVMVIRPGLIVGPYDPSDRFTYWVRRMAEGGEVLAPEAPDVARVQFVDASDMARWIVASAAAGRTGTYNAVAPPVRLDRVLDAARNATGPGAGGPDVDLDCRWVPWSFLDAEGVEPWTDLPAWLPAPMFRLLAADGSAADAAGLVHRSVEEVVADLAEWDQGRPREPLRAGMTRERETELLSRFRAGAPPPGP